MKVIATITDDAAAASVLIGAAAIASMAAASLEALHVGDASASVVQAARTAGVPLRTLGGRAIEAIVDVSAAEDVAAIAIGSSSAGEHAPGRTTRALITLLRKPVLVVPATAMIKHHIQRVLVPLDGNTQGAVAVEQLMQLAADARPQVILAHVYDEGSLPAFSDQLAHEARAWREEFIARRSPPALDTLLELRVGEPHVHLLDILRRSGCDLVALSWGQNLTGERAAVVRRMLAESPVPVLLTPDHTEQFVRSSP